MSVISIPSNYEEKIDRALHNLYQEKRTTLHPGTLIPIYFRRMFRGDVFDFRVAESLLQSEPTFAPLMANWRLRFEWYFDSDANRYGWIDNNTRLTAEEVMNRKHHTAKLIGLYVNSEEYPIDSLDGIRLGQFGCARGNIFDYAGVAPGFTPLRNYDTDETEFGSEISVDFFLTYLNIVRNYHCNRQFPNVPYVNNFMRVPFSEYKVDYMDKLFMALRSAPNGISFNLADLNTSGIPQWLYEGYYDVFNAFISWLADSYQSPCGGLFCSQYEPDLYQNLLNQDQGLLRSTVRVTNGQFAIETFRLQNHLQAIYDDIFVSGGRDRDLSRTRWGVKSNRQYDIPELICAYSEIIGTNLITSNNPGTNGDDYSAVPGEMSGNINTRRNGGRRQKFTAKTAGNLMCIVSLTPIVDYSQNIERHLIETMFEDEFSPQMARKGFENVPLTDYCVLPNYHVTGNDSATIFTDDLDTSIGKQVAWLREMTATNRVHGEFSNFGDKEDWVLKRKFGYIVPSEDYDISNFEVFDFTPYVNPLSFQYPFVSQTIADPNFYLQVAFDVRAYRPIGRRFMPTLGR